MKEIPLTQGQVALVDDQDYEELSRHKWSAFKSGKTWYARRGFGPRSHQKQVYMHQQILNPPPGLQCDHINGDGLDNRRCNLRVCTQSQNQHNRRLQGGTSEFKGVHWYKAQNKWRAKITHNGKRYHLGAFPDETDAARAYDNAAREFFGKFARPNFPNEK